MAIKNIIFDLDNTLINADLAYEAALKAIGLSGQNRTFLKARRQVKEQLPKGHVVARNRLLYLKRVLEERNKFSAAELLRMIEIYENALFRHVLKQMKQLSRTKLFAILKKKNIKLAILTNENLRTQLVKLKAIDPQAKYFSHLLTSEEVGYEKPDPRIYQEVLRQTKFKIAETLMVGDDIEADMIGAKNIGFRTVLVCEFTRASAKIPVAVDYVVQSLDELLEIV